MSQSPNSIDLHVRQPELEFPSPWQKHWHSGNAFKSHFFDALSVLFPDGERFFIESVRHYRSRVTEPQKQQQISAFIGQEAHHSREHLHYSEALRSAGYNVDYLERRLKQRLAFIHKHLHPKVHLAATCAIEHLTAIMADALLSNPDWLEGANPHMVRLWRWHALEESEHKAVAFDLYQQVCGSVWLRRRAMLQASFFLTWDTYKGLIHMLKRDGLLGSWHTWRQGLAWLWGRKGILRSLARQYADFYRADFHPWQHNNMHLIQQVRQEFDQPTALTAPLP